MTPKSQTIGQIGQVTINIDLPEGTTNNLEVIDTLPLGVNYNGNVIITPGPGISLIGAHPVQTGSNPDGSIWVKFLWDTVTVSSGATITLHTLSISFDTQIVDNGYNPRGPPYSIIKTNTVSLNWANNPEQPLNAIDTFNVVQPHLNIVKNMNPRVNVIAGTSVTITLTVTNDGTSPAFDVTLTDILNNVLFDRRQFISVNEISTPIGFLYNYNELLGTVTYTGASINNGQSLTFQFRVNVNSNVPSGSTYTNTLNPQYSSLPGTTPGERTYTDTPGQDTLNTMAPAMVKSIFNTSENYSGTRTNVLIGEVVTYQIDFTVPKGTTLNANIIDTLNSRLSFITGTTLSGVIHNPRISRSGTDISSSILTLFDPTQTDINIYKYIDPTAFTPTLTFDLGTITNVGSEGTIRLLFDVVVRNSGGTGSIPNTGSLRFTPATGPVQTVSGNGPNLNVRIPSLAVTKTVTPTVNPQGGTDLTFTIVVRNTAGANVAPVYDVVLTDLINLNFQNIRSISYTPNPLILVYTPTWTGNNLQVNIVRLLQGESLTIRFTVTLNPDVIYGTVTRNTANVIGTSLPGPYGTGGATPGEPGSVTGERTGTGANPPNNILASAWVDVTAQAPSITKSVTPNEQTIGKTVTYTIDVTLPVGTTTGLVVEDVLPMGMEYVSGSSNTLPAVTLKITLPLL